MVISGGHFKPDALKPKEVVSLLLDDAEMESKCTRIATLPAYIDPLLFSPKFYKSKLSKNRRNDDEIKERNR